jgi:hypothetical protein
MARTVAEIKKEITAEFIANDIINNAYELDTNKTFEEQFSVVSLESIFFYIVSSAIWTLEKIFDLHKKEVNDIIATLKPHTTRWYSAQAKLFQYGFNLLPDSDMYDNAGKTDEQITASKIVAYSAVLEVENKLQIKVAKETGDLAPLTIPELSAFSEYMARIKDAGVQLDIISLPADNLRLNIDIYYNPLVLDANGQRLDGTTQTPVADAIRAYLKNMPFNGELVLAYLTDALQAVDGVVIPFIKTAEYQYGGLEFNLFDVKRQPDSGYYRINDENLTINYTPQSEIL